jgi:hypothetical protein
MPLSLTEHKTFKLKKLNQVDGKEQYHVEISNGLAAMEYLDG